MLKFQFLGINGSMQERGGGNTSLLFWGENGCIAVDVSCNIAEIVKADVDAVILTHEHIDHIYGLPSLIHQMWLSGRKRNLQIYTTEPMRDFVNGLIDLFQLRSKNKMFEIRVCAEKEFQVGTMTVSVFGTDHTDMSIGVFVEEGGRTVVYTSDTRPIQAKNLDLKQADVLIHEASGLQEEEEELVRKGHSSAFDAGSLARQWDVKRLYLCHLPDKKDMQKQILEQALAVFPNAEIPTLLTPYLL